MSDGYTIRNLADVDDAAPENGLGEFWEARVARTALSAEQTGVSFFRLKPGRRSAFSHRHEEAEEIYVILRGSGRVKLDEEIVDVAPLDAVRVAPRVVRAFEADADGLDFVVVGAHHPGDGELVDDGWAGGGAG